MQILSTLCYLQKDDKTLMLHRVKKKNDYHKGKWNGLGGKFEPGETPEECAKREIFEESGLKVNSLTLKGFISFPNFDNKNDWYTFIFTSNDFEGNLIDSPEGDLAWIENNRIKELNLWPGDKIFLDWIFQDKFFSAKFFYKNGEFKKYSVDFY